MTSLLYMKLHVKKSQEAEEKAEEAAAAAEKPNNIKVFAL